MSFLKINIQLDTTKYNFSISCQNFKNLLIKNYKKYKIRNYKDSWVKEKENSRI